MSIEGQGAYIGFLRSTHWGKIRDKVYAKHKACQICRKPYNLHSHHIDYARRGMLDEWKDVRLLCENHHVKCHYILFFRIPRSATWLISRYYYLKTVYKLQRILIGKRE